MDLPDNTQLLPWSFGFTYENKRIQGTSYIHKDTRQIGVAGWIDEEEFVGLDDLASKTQWTEVVMKTFITKIQEIFSKQQSGK